MARIVLVEDDELLSEMYTIRLQQKGYECIPALNGADGLELIKNSLPDLVLLDLMLPKMSGDEVLSNLRAFEPTKNTKVLIMTNISEAEAPDLLKTLKFERYIVKANHTLNDIVQIIDETLGTSPAPATV